MSTPAAAVHGLGEPSPWVRDWAHLVAAGGAVLDVASGAGRHARFFASRGHPVTAIDRDCAALDLLCDVPLVTPLVADLEGAAWPLPADAKFAAVVVTNYLHRPLFESLLQALAPGGVLVYETFAQGNESVGKPSNPAFLLAPGELLERVRGRLRVVAFQDGYLAQPRPAYVQRICAILEAERSDDPMQAASPRCYGLAG
ncbi:MAG TPA: class I SAM-dependent methyltransferase [Paraburkholderia sp.]